MIKATKGATAAGTTTTPKNETGAQNGANAIPHNFTMQYGDMRVVELSLLLDERQASQYLGVSLSFLRKSRSEGSPGNRTPAPPFIKLGGRCLYRRSDLDYWVADLAAQRVC